MEHFVALEGMRHHWFAFTTGCISLDVILGLPLTDIKTFWDHCRIPNHTYKVCHSRGPCAAGRGTLPTYPIALKLTHQQVYILIIDFLWYDTVFFLEFWILLHQTLYGVNCCLLLVLKATYINGRDGTNYWYGRVPPRRWKGGAELAV